MPKKKRKPKERLPFLPMSQRQVLPNAPEEFLIRHLPLAASIVDDSDELPNLFVPSLDYIDLASELRHLQKTYEKTKNGTFLLSAYVITYKCGFYPPMWVLNGLAGAFQAYWAKPLNRSIDALLGLKARRGQDQPLKSAATRERNESIAWDMFLLCNHFRLTITEAAEVAQKKFEKYPILMKSKRGPGPYAVETLVKWYPNWVQIFGLTRILYEQITLVYQPNNWQEFLNQFPQNDLTDDVKQKLMPPA